MTAWKRYKRSMCKSFEGEVTQSCRISGASCRGGDPLETCYEGAILDPSRVNLSPQNENDTETGDMLDVRADLVVALFRKASLAADSRWVVRPGQANLKYQELRLLQRCGFLEERGKEVMHRWIIPEDVRPIAQGFRDSYST